MAQFEIPMVYEAYDKDGKFINSYKAKWAINDINIVEIKSAVDKIKETIPDQLQEIADALTNISSDEQESIVVKGVSQEGVIEGIAEEIVNLGEAMVPATLYDAIVSTSLTVYNEFQQEYNEEAMASAKSAAGTDGSISSKQGSFDGGNYISTSGFMTA